ncbi:hypothetical protein M378DRAFT_173251 [Amanita muscaria Koide BX008]|uniref:Uncharacterized protein n=1 Tax=Amanita muscaria (strain Koide BX008) TaxID=946122 RepID=A0A0C2WI77_AMAMK|nr:hypothetical protein M378DRAFT_173251 [Amanita muscaria Koide BX008]
MHRVHTVKETLRLHGLDMDVTTPLLSVRDYHADSIRDNSRCLWLKDQSSNR